MQAGDLVRLKNDVQRIGTIRQIIDGKRCFAKVAFSDSVKQIPINQLELQPETPDPPEALLREGRLSPPGPLRLLMAHLRLAGRMGDIIYSMEATNTDFHAHQFTPLLKLLRSPTGRLLIADEVGLGKTIEAGLIWTELRVRFDHRRLLVVCPKALTAKWRMELRSKFNVAARIVDAAELLDALREEERAPAGFALIASVSALRPDRQAASGSARARLQAELEKSDGDRLFDLVVIDEAHHLRNPETMANRLGTGLAGRTNHLLLLSATPIHLKNEDLLALLRLLDPATYADRSAFAERVEANAPLIRAREMAKAGRPIADIVAELMGAEQHRLLRGSRALALLRARIAAANDERAAVREAADELDRINLLADTVTRTRRRDVQELRVLREPVLHRAIMNPVERAAYDRITAAVADYATEHDLAQAFLLASPQRLLASSVPAAIAHWRTLDSDPGDEDADADDDREQRHVGPLTAQVMLACRDLGPTDEIARHDTKYDLLRDKLRRLLQAEPREKIIVFSSFRVTIAYLARRLADDGFVLQRIDGTLGDEERGAALETFRESMECNILLSSEVGSEGIDLQFTRVMVNYDLPWNPMRVEQRIGRIDRIGQEADKIRILNLVYQDTIDDRISTRLYDRLDLCKNAVGDFEDIIGPEIDALTSAFLDPSLSDAQRESRADQAARAIETRRRQEEDLQHQAAGLFAHGEFIQRALDAHARGQWIHAGELRDYTMIALPLMFAGSTVTNLKDEDTADIFLSVDARNALLAFADASATSSGRLGRDTGTVRCRFGRPPRGSRLKETEIVPQTHPLIRLLTRRMADGHHLPAPPAVGARLARTAIAGLSPGRYLAAAERWTFTTPAEREDVLACAGIALVPGAMALDPADARRLIEAAALNGQAWIDAGLSVDANRAADVFEAVVAAELKRRFDDEIDAREARTHDRIEQQLRIVQMAADRDVTRLQQTIDDWQARGVNTSLIAANLGQIRNISARAQQAQSKLEAARNMTPESGTIAVVLVEILP